LLWVSRSRALPPSLTVRAQGELRREFFDPCLGSRWHLVTNPEHPEWPGRLVLVEAGGLGVDRSIAEHAFHATEAPTTVLRSGEIPVDSGIPAIVIRAGERVTVDQQTQVLHARFQAIALESAIAGQRMRVRLGAGTHSARGLDGVVIPVLATAPGQARWLAGEGVAR
jgi:hypothetical protein